MPKFFVDGSSGDVSFYEDTGTTAKMYWDASAESLGIGTTTPGTELDVNGDITAGGIYLGGTGAANYLDDYEEGTWTPAYSTSGGSFTYDTATQGMYTKIGNVVTLYFRIYTNSATVGSGDVSITGIPFAEAITSGLGAGAIADCRLFGGDMPNSLGISGSSIILYFRTSANGANARLQASDLDTGGVVKNLIDGQITYITS